MTDRNLPNQESSYAKFSLKTMRSNFLVDNIKMNKINPEKITIKEKNKIN
jgi:hypothetical protein